VSLRKGLTRLDGVADAKLIIKPPHMEVRMKPGFRPDLVKMQQTVKDAGFKPIEGGVELRVTGKVAKAGDKLTLEADGMKEPLTFALVAAKGDLDTLAHLEEKHLGMVVEVTGQWQPDADPKAPGSLAVTAIGSATDKVVK
jgi:hypothetical protein